MGGRAVILTGYPRHKDNREMGNDFENVVKTQGILSKHRENTGNFVCSSCKCYDYKSKGYCDTCHKKIFFSPMKLDRSAKSVLCV